MATLYNADQKTGIYLAGQDCEAFANPMWAEETHGEADRYLYNPKTASLTPPPEPGEDEAVRLVGGEWDVVIDRGGQHYYEPDGAKIVINSVGDDIPAGCIQDDPPSEYHTTHDGVAWIADLAMAKTAKIADIQAEKKRIRDGGVMVEVAGESVLFDTDATARIGYAEYALQLQSDPGMTVAAWKASPGQWVEMTAALYNQVILAGRALMIAAFAWQMQQEALVDAAETIDDIMTVSAVYSSD